MQRSALWVKFVLVAGIATALAAAAQTPTPSAPTSAPKAPPTASPQPASAQSPAAPLYATTKVADNVYVFRYGGHQAMFVVTPAGVLATDPIA
ncbi:MAG: hypothetical protein ABJB78_07365, partial [Betaproteobacteria bacterium]